MNALDALDARIAELRALPTNHFHYECGKCAVSVTVQTKATSAPTLCSHCEDSERWAAAGMPACESPDCDLHISPRAQAVGNLKCRTHSRNV